ncbi:hypothetical protein V501_01481 [Pseudogymnoascus sp. VKM F-4519 (FW-2642)]|nr:hypothetical protein V501_01481 [Pseudogymnoascus sp. VKM F-4519 (FW-2642)]
MSKSSLSPPPPDEYENDSQELSPALPLVRMPVRSLDPSLPDSDSVLFTKGLYSRTILDTTPSELEDPIPDPEAETESDITKGHLLVSLNDYRNKNQCNGTLHALRHGLRYWGLCHCADYPKLTGSTYSTNAIFPKSAFTIISGEQRVYEAKGGSENFAFANFYRNYSSTRWTATPLRSGIVLIKVGILGGDALEKLAPKVEAFTSRKRSWMKSVDGAAQFEKAIPAPPSQ